MNATAPTEKDPGTQPDPPIINILVQCGNHIVGSRSTGIGIEIWLSTTVIKVMRRHIGVLTCEISILWIKIEKEKKGSQYVESRILMGFKNSRFKVQSILTAHVKL